jgi:hypothetical protein
LAKPVSVSKEDMEDELGERLAGQYGQADKAA